MASSIDSTPATLAPCACSQALPRDERAPGRADPELLSCAAILDQLNDGIYVTDNDRRIVFWSAAAERITGWKAADVLGRHCRDNILVHVDKDGRHLCADDRCPLHRSIVTGERSAMPLLVYARTAQGKRVPTLVSVAPIRNARGEVIGGVECFRDATETAGDLERAQKIQRRMMQLDLPEDPRRAVRVHYRPHDIVGGDFVAVEDVGRDLLVVFVADVMGHGLASALYTMHLKSLWVELADYVEEPAHFLEAASDSLHGLISGDTSFATAAMALVDLRQGRVITAGAGGPAPLLYRHGAAAPLAIDCSGLPLGITEGATYQEDVHEFGPGDVLLFYSDGATEIHDAQGNELAQAGLASLLARRGYPGVPVDFDVVERDLMAHSNAIRLEDDLLLLEVRRTG